MTYITKKKTPTIKAYISTRVSENNKIWHVGLVKDENNSGTHELYHVIENTECKGLLFETREMLLQHFERKVRLYFNEIGFEFDKRKKILTNKNIIER